jgi:hypothetical protein
MKQFALLLALLTWLFAGPVHAAITVNNSGAVIGVADNSASNSTTFNFPTTVDAASGTTIIVGIAFHAGATAVAVTDTQGNCSGYAVTTHQLYDSSTAAYYLAYCHTTTDLPAPCTVTASAATDTSLVITAVSGSGFCTSSATLPSGTYVTGTSFSSQTVLNGSCTLTSGAGTCAISGNTGTPGSETVTLSSAFHISWTTSTVVAAAAIDVSGLATSSPLDVTATAVQSTSASTLTVSGVTLGQASELLVGLNPMIGSYSAWAANGSWNLLAAATINANINMPWAYQIVSSTTGPSWAPSWTTATNAGADYWSFKAAGAAGGCGSLNTQGAGC